MQFLGVLEAGQPAGAGHRRDDEILGDEKTGRGMIVPVTAGLPAVLVLSVGIPPFRGHALAAVAVAGQADAPVQDRALDQLLGVVAGDHRLVQPAQIEGRRGL